VNLSASAQVERAIGNLEVLTSENASRLEQLGMIGYGSIEDVAWSPDGETVAVAGSLGLIFYDAELFERAPFERWQLPEEMVHAVAYSPDGALLATVSGERLGYGREMVFRLWDVATGSIISEWTQQEVGLDMAIAFSPDGQLAVRTIGARGVPRWDVGDPCMSTAAADELGHSRSTRLEAI
jgi:WD40 repeat protein